MAVRDATMAIVYDCVCGEQITAPDERAGKVQRCPACRISVLVPEAAQPRPRRGADRPGSAGKASAR